MKSPKSSGLDFPFHFYLLASASPGWPPKVLTQLKLYIHTHTHTRHNVWKASAALFFYFVNSYHVYLAFADRNNQAQGQVFSLTATSHHTPSVHPHSCLNRQFFSLTPQRNHIIAGSSLTADFPSNLSSFTFTHKYQLCSEPPLWAFL